MSPLGRKLTGSFELWIFKSRHSGRLGHRRDLTPNGHSGGEIAGPNRIEKTDVRPCYLRRPSRHPIGETPVSLLIPRLKAASATVEYRIKQMLTNVCLR